MFSPIDSKLVGQNIAKLRRHRDVKAADIASKIGLSESAYTKYERGETAITVEFLNRVAEEFEVSASELISATPYNIIENIHDRAIGVNHNETINVTNEAHEKLLETILEQNKSITEQNKQLTALLEKLAGKLQNIVLLLSAQNLSGLRDLTGFCFSHRPGSCPHETLLHSVA